MALNLYSSTTTDTLLAAKVDLAGGTMTGALTLSAAGIIFSDSTYLTTAPAGSTLAADQLTAGVVTANPTAGPTASGDVLQYDGTNLVWAPGGGGGANAANQLTASVVTANPATGPSTDWSSLYYAAGDLYWSTSVAAVQITNGYATSLVTNPTPGQVLSFNSASQLEWISGVPGSVSWGGITGTVTDQTDLTTYLSGAYYPLSGNPSGFITSVPGKTVYEVTSNAYTLASTDANNIVYIPGSASGGFPPINITVPDDATYSFPVGTVITLSINNSVGGSDVNLILGDPMAPAPTIVGTTGFSSSTSGNFLLTKVAGNLWICS